MLSGLQNGFPSAFFAFRGKKLLRFQPTSAGFTLVPASAVPMAVRTFPFDVAIRKKAVAVAAKILFHGLFRNETLLIQREEKLLGYLVVQRQRRARVIVEP